MYFIYDTQDNFRIVDTPGFIVAPDGTYAPLTDAHFVPVEDPATLFCSCRCVCGCMLPSNVAQRLPNDAAHCDIRLSPGSPHPPRATRDQHALSLPHALPCLALARVT